MTQTMTTNISGSATIYAFPARGRFASVGQREASPLGAAAPSTPAVRIVSGSGWYHDEAIQQAKADTWRNS